MTRPEDIRDLSDFCMNWPDIRAHVTEAALIRAHVPDTQRDIIRWLCELAEKHCAFEE